jgi:hypothetical protein
MKYKFQKKLQYYCHFNKEFVENRIKALPTLIQHYRNEAKYYYDICRFGGRAQYCRETANFHKKQLKVFRTILKYNLYEND